MLKPFGLIPGKRYRLNLKASSRTTSFKEVKEVYYRRGVAMVRYHNIRHSGRCSKTERTAPVAWFLEHVEEIVT